MFYNYTDFEIKKENDTYFLFLNETKIKCAFGKNYISSKSLEFIEMIVEDFDRCSEINLNKNNSLDFGYRFGPYAIFSDQLANIPNEKSKKDFINRYVENLHGDWSLIQIANGPPLEVEQISRLMPVRDAIKKFLGEQDFNELTEYAWAHYYVNSNFSKKKDYAGPGKFISDEDFKNTRIYKKFHDFCHELPDYKVGALWGLMAYALENQSFLLPLAFLSNWINKKEFIFGAVGLGNNILNFVDDSSIEGYDKNEHYHKYYDHVENAASIAYQYCEVFNSPLLVEESLTHEFKASLRVPYPSYPTESKNEKNQKVFKLGKNVFNSKKDIHTFLEKIILKTIASFLNTKGGTLVIGVHEFANKKNVVGIDREGFESHDHYERHLIQILNNAFGTSTVSSYVSTEISNINEIPVCVLNCEQVKGEEIVYFDDQVYVRTGPRIDKLSVKGVIEHLKRRQK